MWIEKKKTIPIGTSRGVVISKQWVQKKKEVFIAVFDPTDSIDVGILNELMHKQVR